MTSSHSEVRNKTSGAYMLGEGMLAWAKGHLAAAATRGDKVMVLGHIPPYHGMWCAGFYRRWITALEPYYRAQMMLPHFFGHMHTDEWQVVRACAEAPPPPSPAPPAPPPAPVTWTKTTGVKWCSGGDMELGFDPFGR